MPVGDGLLFTESFNNLTPDAMFGYVSGITTDRARSGARSYKVGPSKSNYLYWQDPLGTGFGSLTMGAAINPDQDIGGSSYSIISLAAINRYFEGITPVLVSNPIRANLRITTHNNLQLLFNYGGGIALPIIERVNTREVFELSIWDHYMLKSTILTTLIGTSVYISFTYEVYKNEQLIVSGATPTHETYSIFIGSWDTFEIAYLGDANSIYLDDVWGSTQVEGDLRLT